MPYQENRKYKYSATILHFFIAKQTHKTSIVKIGIGSKSTRRLKNFDARNTLFADHHRHCNHRTDPKDQPMPNQPPPRIRKAMIEKVMRHVSESNAAGHACPRDYPFAANDRGLPPTTPPSQRRTIIKT